MIFLILASRTHPEVPDRIQRPYDKHKEYGLLERCQTLPVSKKKYYLNQEIIKGEGCFEKHIFLSSPKFQLLKCMVSLEIIVRKEA